MIDYSLPLRLSNGREAELVKRLDGGRAVVRIKGAFEPEEEDFSSPDEWHSWNYDENGKWIGFNATTYWLVNVDMAHELECEDWS